MLYYVITLSTVRLKLVRIFAQILIKPLVLRPKLLNYLRHINLCLLLYTLSRVIFGVPLNFDTLTVGLLYSVFALFSQHIHGTVDSGVKFYDSLSSLAEVPSVPLLPFGVGDVLVVDKLEEARLGWGLPLREGRIVGGED